MFWDTNNTNIQLKKNYKKKKMQIKQFKSLKQFNTILKKICYTSYFRFL